MRIHVTYPGEGHSLTRMFSLTLMILLFKTTLSTTPLSSDLVSVSNCEIPEVREGDHATLACHFDHNLKDTKRGVKVVQNNSTTTALVCLWHFDKPDCIVRKGFELNGEISNELRLDIPRVTKEQAGIYSCIVFDSEPGAQSTCALNVIDSDRVKSPSWQYVLEAVVALCAVISVVLWRRNKSL